MAETSKPSRREFVTTAGLVTAGVTIVPRHVLGRGMAAPSDTFNVAIVGVGGMGRSNMTNLADHNIVALCDVDWGYADRRIAAMDEDAARLQKRLEDKFVEETPPASARGETGPAVRRPMTPLELERGAKRLARLERVKAVHLQKATRHTDYRRMLEQQKDIDGVVVATPDHLHAGIALAAMDLGKHVYVQKPLTWSVAEARQLARRAAETKVATQMGNQGQVDGRHQEGRRVALGRRDWRRARGPRLDEPAARLLAAGHPEARRPFRTPATCRGTAAASPSAWRTRSRGTTRRPPGSRGTCSSGRRR